MPAPAGVQPGAEPPREPSSGAPSTTAGGDEATGTAHVEAPGVPARGAEEPDPASGRSTGRRVVQVLKIIGVVIALPVLALLIGLLIAWIVHVIRGGDGARIGNGGTGATVAPTLAPNTLAPNTSAPVPSASASGATPSSPAAITVPSDWIAESEPPAGVTFRHPSGWIRRTSGTAVFRFAPITPTSTAPGIEGIGVQVAAAGVTPDAAIRQFVGSNYGGQPGYSATAPAALPASTPGKHDGEVRSVVRYTRSGVPVAVVVDAYPLATANGTRTVVVLGRSANSTPTRAAQLEAFAEASLKAS